MAQKQLLKSLNFIEEIDKLKSVYRQCLIMNSSREENSAEHSFSLAFSVIILADFSNSKIDILKTIKMALVHDLVEIYAGDKFHYHKSEDIFLEEVDALKKCLGPLENSPLANELELLWHEFESADSREAIFLRGIDRFLPMFHNFKTEGHSWKKHNISKGQAIEKNSHIEDSSKDLWEYTKSMLSASKEKGYLL